MRTPFLAGNWKMYKTVGEALAFVEETKHHLRQIEGIELGFAAPSVTLYPLAEALRDTHIRLGAQNMHWENEGAFTGEISPNMLKHLADFVVIGHSERRQHFAETDDMVNRKLKSALAHELVPIVCVGESLEQNQAGETHSFVSSQVKAAFNGISGEDALKVVVAYEPIWAIGTGLAATAEDANRIIGESVRGTLAELFGAETAEAIRIQYGGSIKTSNIEELMIQPEIDGGLVGGASLEPESFITLCQVTAKVKKPS